MNLETKVETQIVREALGNYWGEFLEREPQNEHCGDWRVDLREIDSYGNITIYANDFIFRAGGGFEAFSEEIVFSKTA